MLACFPFPECIDFAPPGTGKGRETAARANWDRYIANAIDGGMVQTKRTERERKGEKERSIGMEGERERTG